MGEVHLDEDVVGGEVGDGVVEGGPGALGFFEGGGVLLVDYFHMLLIYLRHILYHRNDRHSIPNLH